MRQAIGLFCLLVLGLPLTLSAQVSSRGVLSQEALARYGLEKMWQTQVDFDSAKGRLVEVIQQVSLAKGYSLYEVMYDGRRHVFSQHDRNAFGDEIGIEGAKAKADALILKIKADLKAAGKPETDAPKAEKRLIPRIRLYATGERGSVHAIDGETGKTVWSTTVGRSNLPMSSAGASDTLVVVCNGSTMYILDADNGSINYERRVMGAPSTGPAVSEGFAYVPMISGAIEMYSMERPDRPPFVFRSFGRPSAQPTVSERTVSWPTESGKLYVGDAQEGELRFRIEASDAITSAPVFMNGSVIFCSHDGYIYSVEEMRGAIQWRFTTGSKISTSPLVIGDKVIAVTDMGDLYCLALTTGEEQWIGSGVRGFLSATPDRIYCYDRNGNVLIFKTQTGNRIGRLNTIGLDVQVQNNLTDRIVLGTSSGLLQCVREINHHWPDFRDPTALKGATPAQQPARRAPASGASEEGAAEPATGADPFGGDAAPAAEAPAGAEPAEEMPAAETPAAPAADDPFE